MGMINTVLGASVQASGVGPIITIPNVLYVKWFIEREVQLTSDLGGIVLPGRLFVGGTVATKDSGIADELISRVVLPGIISNDVLSVQYGTSFEDEPDKLRRFFFVFFGGDGSAKMETVKDDADKGQPSLHLIPFMCTTTPTSTLSQHTVEEDL